jgi:hypothetical protein
LAVKNAALNKAGITFILSGSSNSLWLKKIDFKAVTGGWNSGQFLVAEGDFRAIFRKISMRGAIFGFNSPLRIYLRVL